MRYIVDGYNVINSNEMFSADTLEGRRNKLFGFINSNKPQGSDNNSVTIVFDCKVKDSYETNSYSKTYLGEIEIIFSDGYASADDIIVKICDSVKNPLEIMVVTNDRGIHRRIALSGAKHTGVESFLEKGQKNKNIVRPIKKVSDNSMKEINEELKKLWL
jgi:predicted RNA-binding protein with PIN domain